MLQLLLKEYYVCLKFILNWHPCLSGSPNLGTLRALRALGYPAQALLHFLGLSYLELLPPGQNHPTASLCLPFFHPGQITAQPRPGWGRIKVIDPDSFHLPSALPVSCACVSMYVPMSVLVSMRVCAWLFLIICKSEQPLSTAPCTHPVS